MPWSKFGSWLEEGEKETERDRGKEEGRQEKPPPSLTPVFMLISLPGAVWNPSRLWSHLILVTGMFQMGDSSECRDVVLGRRGLLEKLLTRWTDKETRAWRALQGEKSKAVGQRGAVLTAFWSFTSRARPFDSQAEVWEGERSRMCVAKALLMLTHFPGEKSRSQDVC